MQKAAEPSDLELQVLALLWERGEMTARQVLEALPDGKPRAYTSVLSVIQVMEKKGFLTHTTAGKTHVYKTAVARAPILGLLVKNLVKMVFGGRPSAAVQTLLEQTDVSADEVAEMRRLLEAKAQEPTPARGTGKVSGRITSRAY